MPAVRRCTRGFPQEDICTHLLFTTAAAPVVGLTGAVVSWIIDEPVLTQNRLWHLCIEPALRAVTMVLAYSCAITLYRRAKVGIFGEMEEDTAAYASSATVSVKRASRLCLLLAYLNLIPVPPLDGSWILSGLLSEKARRRFEKLRPYSLLLLLAIFLTPALDVLLFVPLVTTVGVMQLCFWVMGFG